MRIPFGHRRIWLSAMLSLTLFACHQADQPVISRRMALIAALKDLRGRINSGDKGQIGGIFSFPVPDSVFKTYFDDSLFQVQKKRSGDAITQAMFNAYFSKISSTLQLDEFQHFFSFTNLDDLIKKDTIQLDTAIDKEKCNRVYTIEIQNDSNVYISYGSTSFNMLTPEAAPKTAAGTVKDTASSMKDPAGRRKDSAGLVNDSAGLGKDTAGNAKDPAAADDVEDGEDSSACEYTIFWVFLFDGKHLKLQYMAEAE